MDSSSRAPIGFAAAGGEPSNSFTAEGGGFDVVGGSVAGSSHRRVGSPNQDAWACARIDNSLVAVVADGCSQGRATALGASLGACFAVAEATRQLRRHATLERTVKNTTDALVEELARLRTLLSVGDDDAVVGHALLFTLHIAIVTEREFMIAGVGDGVVSVNGGVTTLIAEGNAPDYLAYRLVSGERLIGGERTAPLVIHARGDSREVDSIVIASDGVSELIERAHETLDDGSVLGGLAPFEREARFLKNPSLLQKRLLLWSQSGGCRGGPVDDTTLVVIRRTPCP